MAAPSVSACDKLTFVPSKSVTFMPNGSKQMAEMSITNESDKTVMFKMKSTRPGMFKMRPVYGAVAPNDKTTVRLIFKGLKPGQEAPRKERFTIVAAIAPTACVDTEKIWKSHKYQEKLIESELSKKRFKILFFGINDQEEDDEEEKKQAEEKNKEKKGINEGDADGEDKAKATGAVQKEKIVENVIIKKEIVQQPPRKLVMVMYRDQKDDSLSGDDEDDADAAPVPQPDPSKVKSTAAPPKSAVTQVQTAKPGQPPSTSAPPKSAVTQVQTTKPGQPSTAGGPKSLPPTKGPAAPSAVQQKQIQQMDDDLLGAKTCRINKNFELRPSAPVPNK